MAKEPQSKKKYTFLLKTSLKIWSFHKIVVPLHRF